MSTCKTKVSIAAGAATVVYETELTDHVDMDQNYPLVIRNQILTLLSTMKENPENDRQESAKHNLSRRRSARR